MRMTNGPRIVALLFGPILPLVAFTALSSAAPVRFEINANRRYEISPYIYGSNQPNWQRYRGLITLTRWGGNRTTTYNWETNASNAGADWRHQNDAYLCQSNVRGEGVRRVVAEAQAASAATIVTIPIAGYVAADNFGGGDVAQTPDYLQKRFHRSLACKNRPLLMQPDLLDSEVYQDEFIGWLESTFSQARTDYTRTIFYALDNEPELWSQTHPRIHPRKTLYEEIVRLNIEYASMIKAVSPRALVFGPVNYGWNAFTSLQDAPDGQGRDFLDFYLTEMRAAEHREKRRLLDVLDIHWYPAVMVGKTRVTDDSNHRDVAEARMQAPRSLWDPSYVEPSWITEQSTHGAICLLPRLREKIFKHYPNTRLAISEYYFGGGNDISGALAEADALGIFAREGVFAAALWHQGKTDDRFIYAAFAMYRNYDGQGGRFGSTGIWATTNDPAQSSVYASLDESDRVVIVALNKTVAPLAVSMEVQHAREAPFAEVYHLTQGNPRPVRGNDIMVGVSGLIRCELPGRSVSTIVLKSPPRPKQ